MTGGSSWFQRFLLPGFAFKAVVIGGGYATGRELVEFFVGRLGGLLAMDSLMGLVQRHRVVTFCSPRMILNTGTYRSFFRNWSEPLGPLRTWRTRLLALNLATMACAGAIGVAMFGGCCSRACSA